MIESHFAKNWTIFADSCFVIAGSAQISQYVGICSLIVQRRFRSRRYSRDVHRINWQPGFYKSETEPSTPFYLSKRLTLSVLLFYSLSSAILLPFLY